MTATPPTIPAMFQLRAFLLYSTAASWLPDSSAVLACKNVEQCQLFQRYISYSEGLELLLCKYYHE